MTAALFPVAVYSQTLDQAIKAQLDVFNNKVCGRLLGDDDPLPRLTGPLAGPDLCTRTPPAGGGSPSASGGGAATPTMLPAIVQKRLRETHGEEKTAKTKPKTGDASVDRVAKLGSGLSLFVSGQFESLNRNVTTFEDGFDSPIRGVTGNTDNRITDWIKLRQEEKRLKISKASYPGSSNGIMSQQPDFLAMPRAHAAMGAGSDIMNWKPATIEIAMGPLQVTGVEIEEATTNSAIIRIQADQPVTRYETFLLDNPPRIVIDIQDAFLTEPTLREEAGKGPIKQIRSSQFRRKPEPVVRVVIDLVSTLPYQVVGLPDSFRLLIGEAVAKAEQFETPKTIVVPLQVMGVNIQEATADSAIIQIQSNKPVIKYNTFMLSDPPRIVIDITGALLNETMSREKAGQGPIKQIRSSQFGLKPKPVVRVVLDLASALPYQVAGFPDTFQLFIGEAVAKADQVKPVVPPPVTAKRPKPAPEELLVATGPVEPFWRGASVWGAGEYEDLDRDRTKSEDGYDSDIWRVTVGADYQFSKQIMAGLAFDYYHHDGDYDGGGGFENDSYGFLAYGSFQPFDQTFLQVTAGYTRKTYERKRFATFIVLDEFDTIDTEAKGFPDADYDADQFSAGLLVGYDYPIGNVSISPRAGFDYRYVDYDTYSESGSTGLELTFHDDDQQWLQSRVGVQTLLSFSTDFGLIVPQASFDWMHEFENDQRDVKVSFVGDTKAKRFTYETENPDRNWFEINAGVVTALPNGLQVFGNYRTIVRHSFFDSHAGTIGLRYAF